MGQEILHKNVPDHVPADRVYEFDIYNDPRLGGEGHADYAFLHAEAPDIFYTPLNGGHWVLTRFEHCFEAVRDYEHFSVREMQIPRVPNPPVFIPLSLDPPANIPYRKALPPVFAPKNVARMEPRVREFAIEIIEPLMAKGGCEFVAEVSSRFPVSVFMELMGLPLDQLRAFREIADSYFNARSGEENEAAVGRIIGIFMELIALRQAEPQDDLISKILEFDIGERKIAQEEVLSICLILFLGGMDTVTNVSSYAFRLLARRPDLQKRLAEDTDAIPAFIEEALRSFGVINNPRIVTQDCRRFGVDFKKDEMIICLMPLAGRDDRKHDKPHEFDMDRESSEHMIFSSGPHLCLGQYLAKLEIRILIEEWLKRIPLINEVPGTTYTNRFGMVMALESLPLSWNT